MELTRFQEIYKSRSLRFGTAVQPASLSQRINNVNQQRRSSRNTFMMQKRKIVEGALTPIASPAVGGKTKKQTPVVLQENKKGSRLEMLRRWQEDRKKRLEQQKANKKPVFKVHHVDDRSAYNLDKIYSEIKGKPVVTSAKKKKLGQSQSNLAPSSTYKFKPPANVRPIALKAFSTTASSGADGMPKLKPELAPNKRITRSQKSAISPPLPLPARTRQKLNFQSAGTSKANPVKKEAPAKTTKTISKVACSEPSTSSGVQRSRPEQRNRKSLSKILHTSDEDNLNSSVTDLTSLSGDDKQPEPTKQKIQKRRSRSEGQLNKTTDTINREAVNITTRRQRRQFTRQNAIDLISPKIQRKRVQGNKKTEAVPDSTDDDQVFHPEIGAQKKKTGGKGKQTKLEHIKLPSTSSSLSPEYPLTREINTTNSESSVSPSQPVTPQNKKSSPPNVIYVSPFVTMSRGKENARKEFHRRSSKGGSDFQDSTSPKAAAAYFYNLLNNQTDRLGMLCHKWNLYKDEQKPAEEVCDMINVAVGQTDLLLNKKFEQFRGLVESCESGNSEKPVTCLDLHGFWDMVMIQVKNLDKRFENLNKLKENGWEEILPSTSSKQNQRNKPKRRAAMKTTTSTKSSLRAAIQEARRKKAAELQASANDKEIYFPSTSGRSCESSKPRLSRRSSIRIATMTSEANRTIGSPGLTMMKVTQAAKSAEKSKAVTPVNRQTTNTPKSILKSRKSKSTSRQSKKVLFQQNGTSSESEEQENDKNVSNMMLFTPPGKITRRSVTLSKFK